MVKVIAWNIARRDDAWRYLLERDADVALLSEAAAPPADIVRRLAVDGAPWRTGSVGANRRWRAAVVKLSDRVDLQWLEPKPLPDALSGHLPVSQPGTLAAAIVTPAAAEPFAVVSMYATWETPHVTAGSRWFYADASVHRIISDISALIGHQRGHQRGHRILAAGDLNILHGYGENGSPYWASRYETVFARMTVLGMSFVGPQAPNGRSAEPWPAELPRNSRNVPTYYATNQTPESATRQLDFVFASTDLAKNVRVRALNEPERWGPSDHCCIEIEVI